MIRHLWQAFRSYFDAVDHEECQRVMLKQSQCLTDLSSKLEEERENRRIVEAAYERLLLADRRSEAFTRDMERLMSPFYRDRRDVQ